MLGLERGFRAGGVERACLDKLLHNLSPNAFPLVCRMNHYITDGCLKEKESENEALSVNTVC